MNDDTPVTFWAEIPRDEDPETAILPCVVGARLELASDGIFMIPAGPPEIAGRWLSGWKAGARNDQWVEVDGPARILDPGEHARVIADAIAAGNRVIGPDGLASRSQDELSAALRELRTELSGDTARARGSHPFKPDCTIPPGDILAAELLERAAELIDATAAAAAVAAAAGLDRTLLQAVIDGTRPIDQAVAEGLHKALGPSVQFWLNLQRNHDNAVARGAAVTRLTGAQDD